MHTQKDRTLKECQLKQSSVTGEMTEEDYGKELFNFTAITKKTTAVR